MNSEDGGMFLILLLLMPLIFVAGFQAGRNKEANMWKDAIPKQMEQLCMECRGLR